MKNQNIKKSTTSPINYFILQFVKKWNEFMKCEYETSLRNQIPSNRWEVV